MIHSLKDIVENDIYHGHSFSRDLKPKDHRDIPNYPKVKYFYSGKINNYGNVFKILGEYLSDIYQEVDCEENSVISNSNNTSIGWYIDMDIYFILKENIPLVSSYAITSKDYKRGDLWISKPSHPYVGSGKFIEIGPKYKIEKREAKIYLGKPITWVLQPLLNDVKLFNEKYKFDLRTYAVIYNFKDTFKAASYKIGIARRCVNIYNPRVDPLSAISNISIQEKIHGYDAEFNLPLIYDDVNMTKDILNDVLSNVNLKRDYRKKIQFLILGLDILIMKDGSFKLIEINADPYFETVDENNEKIASMGFIDGAFGKILPSLLNGKNVNKMKDWEFFSVK